MNYKQLIAAGRTHLAKYPGYAPASGIAGMFPSGARWMYDRLNELDEKDTRPFDAGINYNFYGSLKYGICFSAFLLSIWWFSKHEPLLIPLSILLFYLFEVQFLFLFPLLLDNARKPLLRSLRETYKIGIPKCMFIVIPISFFMMIGLFQKKDIFRNWHIGCLAILIWYNNEIRIRV